MRWLAALLLLAAVPAAAQSVSITPTGAPQPVFVWKRDACEAWDIPDSAARAWRDADGQVHLIAAHHVTRALVGPDFDHLVHECRPLFEGDHADAPDRFDDRAWLSGVYTEDGRTVHALVHNEFQGFRRPDLCPSRQPMRCWRNATTYALSTDGGRSFRQPDPPANLVATPPWRYEGDYGRHVGYFNPSNIVKAGGFYYAMVSTTPYHDQKAGLCLLRTTDLADPKSWRAWDGSGFSVRFIDPYREADADPAQHVCTPVGRNRLMGPIGGIVRHEPSGRFIAVMVGFRPVNGRTTPGFWAATSADLVQWTEPVLIWQAPITPDRTACPASFDHYPSLIDPRSPSRSFETVGDTAFLYLVRTRMAGCKPTQDRDLLRVPVRITLTP
jgi:hypothetical protein